MNRGSSRVVIQNRGQKMPNHLEKLESIYCGLIRKPFSSVRTGWIGDVIPDPSSSVLARHVRPCRVVDANATFPLPPPRHGSASRPPVPDRTGRGAIQTRAAPPSARGSRRVPVPSSASLKTPPLFASSSSLSSHLLLSSA